MASSGKYELTRAYPSAHRRVNRLAAPTSLPASLR